MLQVRQTLGEMGKLLQKIQKTQVDGGWPGDFGVELTSVAIAIPYTPCIFTCMGVGFRGQ